MKRLGLIALACLGLAAAPTGCSSLGEAEDGNSAPAAMPSRLEGWPPEVGRAFPDLTFRDAAGEPFRMASLRGKVVLVEPIGMNCPACNAFAGGNTERGGYSGTRPQADLDALEEILPKYSGGVTMDHPDLVVVHLLLYSMEMRAPTQDDARRWAEHFGMEGSRHRVIFADERFIGSASFNLIPGFQLLDRSLVVRSDSTGHHPKDNLYTQLLPMLGEMIGRVDG